MPIYPLPVEFGPSANLTAFSRLRVANPAYVFDGEQTYTANPLLFEQLTNGSGAAVAFDSTNRCISMTLSSTASGGYAYIQSYEHFQYQPGRTQLIFLTFNFNGAQTGVLKFIGYSAGATNGIELQLNGLTPRIALYSDTTVGDRFVNQADWNDPMDGTGPSQVTIDWTKAQILVIDMQALYVGRIRFYFDLGGNLVQFHEINNANVQAYPYIQTANLPVRAGMSCTATSSTTMIFVCCSIISEGGELGGRGYSFTAASGSVTAGNATRTHIMSLRPRTTFNSIVNRVKFILEELSILVTGNSPVFWELCIGQAFSVAPTYGNVNTTYSAFDVGTGGTMTGNPAVVIAAGFVPASSQVKGVGNSSLLLRYPITLDAAGAVRDNGTLTLLAQGIGSTSAMRAAIDWDEVH